MSTAYHPSSHATDHQISAEGSRSISRRRYVIQGEAIVPVFGDWILRLLEEAPQSPEDDPWKTATAAGIHFSDPFAAEISTAPILDYCRSKLTAERFMKLAETCAWMQRLKLWRQYPNTALILVSLGSRRDFSEKTPFYGLGYRIYTHFADIAASHPDDITSARLALRATIQLCRIVKPEVRQLFFPFQFAHLELLYDLRNKFFQTRHPGFVFERFRERFLIEHPKANDEVTRFEALHPEFFGLPTPCTGSDALLIADEFSKAIRKKDKERVAELTLKQLGGKMRLLQWDLFTRDLALEQTRHRLSYEPATKRLGIEGFLAEEDQVELATVSWSLQKEAFYSSFAVGIVSPENAVDRTLKQRLVDFRSGFYELLDQATEIFPGAYDYLTESFSYAAEGESAYGVMLAEDGELTLFSLLWLLRGPLRRRDSSYADLLTWLEGETTLNLPFRPPTRSEPHDSWWKQARLSDAAQMLGLLAGFETEGYFCTRRWWSLVSWLKRQANAVGRSLSGNLGTAWTPVPWDAARAQIESLSPEELVGMLPVKRVRYSGQEMELIKGLAAFFVSAELAAFIARALRYSQVYTIREFGAEHLSPLVAALQPLLMLIPKQQTEVEYQGVLLHPDPELWKCCRAGFLPLEFLFRAWQPHELHLLIIAMGFIRTSGLVEGKMAPVSMGFATIAGAIPPRVADGLTRPGEAPADVARWIAPYWVLFSSIAQQVSPQMIRDDSEQQGFSKLITSFSHELYHVRDMIVGRSFTKLDTLFTINGTRTAQTWKTPLGDIRLDADLRDVPSWPFDVSTEPYLWDNLKYYLSVWSSSRYTAEELNLNARMPLGSALERLEQLARSAVTARRVVDRSSRPKSMEGLKDSSRKFETELNNYGRFRYSGNVYESSGCGACEWDWPQFAGDQDPKARDLQTAAINTLCRLLLAVFGNTIHHAKLNLTAEVCCEVNLKEDWLIVTLSNRATRVDDDEYKQTGTRAVMDLCCGLLDGKVIDFSWHQSIGEFVTSFKISWNRVFPRR